MPRSFKQKGSILLSLVLALVIILRLLAYYFKNSSPEKPSPAESKNQAKIDLGETNKNLENYQKQIDLEK